MRVAILSDIHGNDVAFEAVMADLEAHPVDQLVCLGDCVQGGPQPAEVVSRLRAIRCPTVMGNADAWLLTGVETGGEVTDPVRRRTLDDVRRWSLERLDARDRETISRFQPTIDVDLGQGRSLLCFHGSPESFDDIILPLTPEEELRRMLAKWAGRFLAGGHTHIQHVRHIDRTFYFNPGSVGVAYRHGQSEPKLDPWAEYAVLRSEGQALALEFRRVPFDVRRLTEVYRSSGRPHADAAIAQYDA